MNSRHTDVEVRKRDKERLTGTGRQRERFSRKRESAILREKEIEGSPNSNID
jgi:hypothetical protein